MTKNNDNYFRNNNSIITGSAGRFGKIISNKLAQLGSNLILVDKNPSGNKDVIKLKKKYKNIKIVFFNFDLTNEEQLGKFADELSKKYKTINLLINNAAYVGDSNLSGWNVDFLNQSNESWKKAMDINLNSSFYLIKLIVPIMRKSKNPNIINISSIYSILAPDVNLYKGTNIYSPAAYSVSKAGILHFTRWLACVLAPKIRVNAISPGGFQSNQSKKFIQKYLKKTPLKRMLKKTDIEEAIVFLGSCKSAYLTGQNLILDGGISLS